jgi:outer membrane immunogenic protein
MFRKSFVALGLAAVSLGATQCASAADLPVKARPMVAPVISWTGAYYGLNAGGTWNDGGSDNVVTSTSDVGYPHGGGPVSTAAHLGAMNAALTGSNGSGPVGFIGGGQIGYNWQISPQTVFGVETDIQWVSRSGSRFGSAVATNDPADVQSHYVGNVEIQNGLSWFGTARGRAGYLITPQTLTYVTGGLAYGGVRSSVAATVSNDVYSPSNHIPTFAGGASDSSTRVGWTVGGGVEWKMSAAWSVKVEYLYYDLGRTTLAYGFPIVDNVTTLTGSASGVATFRHDGHIVRLGINAPFAPTVR